MLMKIMLYLCIVGGCGFYGILRAQKYTERVKLLEDFVQSAELIKIELTYRREPLPELFSRLSGNGKKSGEFFGMVSDEYSRIFSMEECWDKALNEIYGASALKTEDTEIIAEMGMLLGTSGIDGQNSIIEGIVLRLKNRLTDAENEKKTKGKMQISLGFALGITIVILLI